MRNGSPGRVLIRNAGSSCAAAIARQYAVEGWVVSLEISEEDTPSNELVVDVWDAGGYIHILPKADGRVQDEQRSIPDRNPFDRVVDAGAN